MTIAEAVSLTKLVTAIGCRARGQLDAATGIDQPTGLPPNTVDHSDAAESGLT